MLGNPGAGRMASHAREMDPAVVELDEEQDIQPGQEVNRSGFFRDRDAYASASIAASSCM